MTRGRVSEVEYLEVECLEAGRVIVGRGAGTSDLNGDADSI
jgi:hypothetical protein